MFPNLRAEVLAMPQSLGNSLASVLSAATAILRPNFADILAVSHWIGTALPLSTASLLSARFTYVSPAALINTNRPNAAAWTRLVDGGYFDNSGAVTAQEIARTIIGAHKRKANQIAADSNSPHPRSMRVIVLHLPNQPYPQSATLNANQQAASDREFLSEAWAPISTLLQTRAARGTQAVSYLQREPDVELHSIPPCTGIVAAPLGWHAASAVRTLARTRIRT